MGLMAGAVGWGYNYRQVDINAHHLEEVRTGYVTSAQFNEYKDAIMRKLNDIVHQLDRIEDR